VPKPKESAVEKPLQEQLQRAQKPVVSTKNYHSNELTVTILNKN